MFEISTFDVAAIVLFSCVIGALCFVLGYFHGFVSQPDERDEVNEEGW